MITTVNLTWVLLINVLITLASVGGFGTLMMVKIERSDYGKATALTIILGMIAIAAGALTLAIIPRV